MKLITKYQDKDGTYCVEEIWQQSCKDPAKASVMLELIARLREIELDVQVHALLSMNTLVLLSERDHRSPWWVKIECIAYTVFPLYGVYALIPEGIAPWSGAYAYSEVDSLEQAIANATAGIRYCGGWKIPD